MRDARMRHTRDAKGSASEREHFRVYVDGSGMGPFSTRSGYAWLNETTGEKLVKQTEGMTNNVAEYRALYSALRQHLPIGASAEIVSDSQLLCCQFDGTYKVKHPELQTLLEHVKNVISERNLRITIRWVRRSENLAGRLL